MDEYTGAPFYIPSSSSWARPSEGTDESPANLWDLLSQQDGKPQADSCGLKGLTPLVRPALPPVSSSPQPSTSTFITSCPLITSRTHDRKAPPFFSNVSVCVYLYGQLSCQSLCPKGTIKLLLLNTDASGENQEGSRIHPLSSPLSKPQACYLCPLHGSSSC